MDPLEVVQLEGSKSLSLILIHTVAGDGPTTTIHGRQHTLWAEESIGLLQQLLVWLMTQISSISKIDKETNAHTRSNGDHRSST